MAARQRTQHIEISPNIRLLEVVGHNPNIDAVRELAPRTGSTAKREALIQAIMHGNDEIKRVLVEEGADVKSSRFDGRTRKGCTCGVSMSTTAILEEVAKLKIGRGITNSIRS